MWPFLLAIFDNQILNDEGIAKYTPRILSYIGYYI